MPEAIFQITPRESGQTLAAVLKRRLSLTWTEARWLVEQRRVRVNGQVCPDPVRRLKAGNAVDVQPEKKTPRRQAAGPRPKSAPADRDEPRLERQQSPTPSIVYIDDDILVVEKPPGLTTMRHTQEAAEFGTRARRFLPPTLADLLPKLVGDPQPLRAVHRLDRDTSGLVVFARTPQAEARLGQQFRAHTISRKYLALVRGRPKETRIESWFISDRGDGRRGSGTATGVGQRAATHIRVAEELGPFTLVECQLETGRTHQVRIHLGELGTPLCGEKIYDRPLHGSPFPDASAAKRTMLHAVSLGLHHPASGKWMEWHSPLPQDMERLLRELRK